MRRRNHAIWLGVLVTIGGAISYFTFFARFAVLRDVPWVNLPLVFAGVGLSALAVWRAYARKDVWRGRVLAPLGLAVSLFFGGLFCAYVFEISSWLPEPAVASLTLDAAPDFELADQAGRSVRLADYRGRPVLLVFYRGHW